MSLSAKAVRAVASFIPTNIACQLAQGILLSPGQEARHTGVAMFVDVAGFTPLAENLVSLMTDTQDGAAYRASEELLQIINRTFTAIIRPIHANGGIVTRFGGDALTAYFSDSSPSQTQTTVVCAVRCAFEMQQAMQPLQHVTIEGQTFPISIKIGLSYGPAATIILGKPDQFMEVVLVGPVIDDATAAEHHANRGDIVAAANLLQRLSQPATEFPSDSFARLQAAPDENCAYRPTPDPLGGLPADRYQPYLQSLLPYLPQAVYRQVMMTQGDVPGDYRRVSNIFLLFEGLDYTQPGVGQQLQAYVAWAHDTVARFDGTLLRILSGDKGSSLHIIFGAPDKHYDDIERALRCAIALRDDPQRPPYVTRQRFGLASGLVFTAPIGAPERREYTVIGNEINLSARLMTAADPDSILVDDYTHRRAAYQFEFDPLPPLRLKGKSEPVTAYQVRQERHTETALETRLRQDDRPLVGRDHELKDLTRIARRALSGDGRIIALSGSVGIGKTRLIEAVGRYWLCQGGLAILGQCNHHQRNTPYHPWVNFWTTFFQLRSQDDPPTQRRKLLERTAVLAPELQDWIDALADILGLPVPSDSPLNDLDAEGRRQKVRQLSLALIRGQAVRKPVLLLFEDLHWVDEASAELIDYLAQYLQKNRILLCLLFRTSQDLPVEALSLPYATWRILHELPSTDMAALIRTILGPIRISAEIIQGVYDRTQGNPLYVEEIINNLKAGGRLPRQEGAYILTDETLFETIPDSLQDLVKARLDRLATETRYLAQVAAVIDREFHYNILSNVYPYPISTDQMQQRLTALTYANVTAVSQSGTNPSYLFKNALTYEVAYNSLAFARRRSLHRRTAQVIEQQYPDSLDQYFNALAYHYHNAQVLDKAFTYTVEAGIRAQQLYANASAMRYYTQAENYLQRLSLDTHWPVVTKLYLNRAQLYRLRSDMESAHANVDRAIAIARIHADTRSEAEAYNLKAEFAFYQEQPGELRRAAQRAFKLADADDHRPEKATALYHLGVFEMLAGLFDDALQSLQSAHAIAQADGRHALESAALNKIALVWFFDGRLDQALDAFETVRQTRQRLGLKDKEAEALSNIATLQFRLNQPQPALLTAHQAIELAEQAGWQLLIPYVKRLQVEILTYQGEYAQAEVLIREIYTLFNPSDIVGLAYARLTHGREILLDLHRLDEATELLEKSLAITQQHDIFEEMAPTLISLGAIKTRQKRWSEAEAYLQQAISICVERHKGWYLSEAYARLAAVFVQQENLAAANVAIQAGRRAIANRSNPDWQAILSILAADIAKKDNRPEYEVTDYYLSAVHDARRRCRACERYWIFIQAGQYLLDHPKPTLRHQGEHLVQEGIYWLDQHQLYHP